VEILVTASLDDASLDELRQLGSVRYEPLVQTGRLLRGDDLVAALDGIDVFVTEADPVGSAEMSRLRTLKVICSCRGNPVNVDVDAATRHGLLVINTPGRNAEAVAELTVAMMVILGRNIPRAIDFQRNVPTGDSMARMRSFFGLRGHELWSRTIGLVGLGAVGVKVAQRLRPFEVELVAFDPYAPAQRFFDLGVQSVGLDQLMSTSDYVSVHAAVTDSSRGIIGRTQFAAMKPTSFFINTARAAVTDERALVEVLRAHRIAGAALDVYETEPLSPEHPLMGLDNVILLPHIGGNTHEIAIHQGRVAVPDIRRLAEGRKPVHVVNPEVLATAGLPEFRRPAASVDSTGD
jgi:autoinducer 2 (AI-2) kinase